MPMCQRCCLYWSSDRFPGADMPDTMFTTVLAQRKSAAPVQCRVRIALCVACCGGGGDLGEVREHIFPYPSVSPLIAGGSGHQSEETKGARSQKSLVPDGILSHLRHAPFPPPIFSKLPPHSTLFCPTYLLQQTYISRDSPHWTLCTVCCSSLKVCSSTHFWNGFCDAVKFRRKGLGCQAPQWALCCGLALLKMTF